MTPGALWSLSRGATALPGGSVQFSLWASRAKKATVSLVTQGGQRIHHLNPGWAGEFAAVVEDVEPGTDYFYRLDDGPLLPDPVSRHRPAGVHGPTRIVNPAKYRWADAAWTGLVAADLAIYELHVGTFTPGGTFDSAIERIPELRALGVTALEIMPVAEFPGGRNWGYDGVCLYAPQSSYGGPEALRRLIDACHQENLAVILDVVYNHIGPEGSCLHQFGPYLSDRHRTPWGPGWNFDGPERSEVRRYVVDNARYWITEYHVDGLRLDAADKIADRTGRHILEEIATAVRQQGGALHRRVVLLAETDDGDRRFIRGTEEGGYGLDAQWRDDFHHAVHAALTGERLGPLRRFGGVRPLAKALGRTDPGDRFVVCIQNHDQVGNRAAGERLSVLVSPAALRLATATLLLSPHVPLLFMGEEYGELSPFLYFVSHGDPALAAAVREGRRREFSALDLLGAVPDPQDQSTFARSRLDWSRRTAPRHAGLLRLYTDLLQLRRSEPALRPGAARVTVNYEENQRWLRLELATARSTLTVTLNYGEAECTTCLDAGSRVVLSTDDRRYGGSDGTLLRNRELTLPALSAALFRAETA